MIFFHWMAVYSNVYNAYHGLVRLWFNFFLTFFCAPHIYNEHVSLWQWGYVLFKKAYFFKDTHKVCFGFNNWCFMMLAGIREGKKRAVSLCEKYWLEGSVSVSF